MKKNEFKVKCLMCQNTFLSSSPYVRTCGHCREYQSRDQRTFIESEIPYNTTEYKVDKILSMPNEYAKQEQEMSGQDFEQFLWQEIFKLL